MTCQPPEIPEFRDVRQDAETGRWRAVHALTGKPVEADTFAGLALRATSVRIAETWRRAGDQQ